MLRKFTANPDRNWLLAVVLHSCAKFADGAQLTNLEQSVVTAFRKSGLTDDDIKKHGDADKRLPQQMRSGMFTSRFAQLDVKQAYSNADLAQDAPGIVTSVLRLPTVRQLDVPAIHAGTATLADFRSPTRALLREHATSMLVALDPQAPAAAASAANPRVTIKATSFKCIDRQDDGPFSSNEAYWIFGSLGDGRTITTRSQVFGDVDNGESRNFASTDGVIWGQNGAAQALPATDIGTLVSLWEHDKGDLGDVRKNVAAAFTAASGVLAVTGAAAWVAAVTAGVGAVVVWLLGYMDDDHIADSSWVYNRALLAKQLPNVGSEFTTKSRFTDGDGDYLLSIRVARSS
ncbi:hypothetical protein [Streptomyces phaeochromogenes]|uniref:hypothetical protein n=1 Tax=Streptomyces phaeochromogenes TaxID=1923 RepID=UPI002DD8CBD7|nr:hypothetical protein [Streptomyces phaeochromogenes]WRZ30005.1 hypothetical protein OG931_20755 [Streptomyces phaeochromogenes]